mmetsp:Transcript_44894/g.80734  ORF Transcript_44894/g.80734 Transcript_44894/m.80734 type:complete len:593 (+) Transcript_44894:105-1883(+)
MRIQRLLLAFLAVARAQDDETCAAGSGAACKASDTASARPKTVAPSPPAPQPTPQVDLISQEMDELKTLMKLSEDRMALLKELQGAAKEDHSSFPLSEAQLKALRDELPLLSEISGQGERTPVAAAEDYLVSKTIMPLEEPQIQIAFLLFKNQRPSTSSSSSSSSSAAAAQAQTPSVVLVSAQADGQVKIFLPSGELLLSFAAGHEQPVTQMAVSPTHEEHLVVTGDAGGAIRLHRVSVRAVRMSKEQRKERSASAEEKVSMYLGGPQLNVTSQLLGQGQLPAGASGSTPMLTALALGSLKGGRQIVAGDSEGRISIFAKNGTLRGHVDATAMDGPGVEGLHSYSSQIVFRAGMEWGFVNLDKIDVKHVDCPKFEGRVASAAVDSQQLSKMHLADDNGSVWVFNVKKNNCELEKKFPPAAPFKAPVELASIKGFVIAMQKASGGAESTLLALNLSQPTGRRRPGETGPGGHVAWATPKYPIRSWAVQRRQQNGDLVAILSADGHEIEIMEILMQVYNPPAQSDPFSNFKLPVMAVAVVLLLGYQFMKQKGGGSKKGGLGGGLGGLGGGAGGKFGKGDLAGLMNKKRMAARKR